MLPESREVSSQQTAASYWSESDDPLLLDVESFLSEDEHCHQPALPHCWDVTSDSIAAWVATRWDASELVLLKSTDLPTNASLDEARRMQLIDPYFHRLTNETPIVSWCNLREASASIISWLTPQLTDSARTYAPHLNHNSSCNNGHLECVAFEQPSLSRDEPGRENT
jgi:hypothetical protein